MLNGQLSLNPNGCYKSYKSWLPVSLWSKCTNILLLKLLRNEHMHKSTCKSRTHWLKHQVWLKSSFSLFCKGRPKAMDSLKAFSSLAAPLDGTLCSVNTQFSCTSNPNFFLLVRYRRTEQVALTTLLKVCSKSFKNSWSVIEAYGWLTLNLICNL